MQFKFIVYICIAYDAGVKLNENCHFDVNLNGMDEINMKEQVKQRVLAVMDQEQLPDAQFAESIGISRGAVSQI